MRAAPNAGHRSSTIEFALKSSYDLGTFAFSPKGAEQPATRNVERAKRALPWFHRTVMQDKRDL
jgi:hypothetical protein